MNYLSRRRYPSLVGLSLDGKAVRVQEVRRSLGSVRPVQSLEVELAADPILEDPEARGKELRGRLNEAGIKTRRCVVALPMDWALWVSIELPDLSEEDLQAFIQTQAERAFPAAPENLIHAVSRLELSGGERFASVVAVPRSSVELLQRFLKAARLIPASLSFEPVPEGASSDKGGDALYIGIGQTRADLVARSRNRSAALRSAIFGADREEAVAQLTREIRITLGQLPEPLSLQLDRVVTYGRNGVAARRFSDLKEPLERVGLRVDDPPLTQSAEMRLASDALRGIPGEFEFLPPKTSPWKIWRERISSKRNLWLGAGLGLGILIVAGAFLLQGRRLDQLQTEWAAMAEDVGRLEKVQADIQKIRAWHDQTAPHLRLLRLMTEAFPEEGTIWLRRLEIENASSAACVGLARDREVLLAALDRLRAHESVAALNIQQVQEGRELQFSFRFEFRER